MGANKVCLRAQSPDLHVRRTRNLATYRRPYAKMQRTFDTEHSHVTLCKALLIQSTAALPA